MSFGEDLRLFAVKVEGRARDVFIGSATEVHNSITNSSPVTTAPGQPVDTGFLKGTWLLSFPEDWISEVATNASYARIIEEGGDRSEYDPEGVARPADLESKGGTNRKGPSQVGGPHSVLLTRSNWDKLVQDQVRTLTGE
jgi:hypothetical protein